VRILRKEEKYTTQVGEMDARLGKNPLHSGLLLRTWPGKAATKAEVERVAPSANTKFGNSGQDAGGQYRILEKAFPKGLKEPHVC
jgi:hypothetical protein